MVTNGFLAPNRNLNSYDHISFYTHFRDIEAVPLLANDAGCFAVLPGCPAACLASASLLRSAKTAPGDGAPATRTEAAAEGRMRELLRSICPGYAGPATSPGGPPPTSRVLVAAGRGRKLGELCSAAPLCPGLPLAPPQPFVFALADALSRVTRRWEPSEATRGRVGHFLILCAFSEEELLVMDAADANSASADLVMLLMPAATADNEAERENPRPLPLPPAGPKERSGHATSLSGDAARPPGELRTSAGADAATSGDSGESIGSLKEPAVASLPWTSEATECPVSLRGPAFAGLTVSSASAVAEEISVVAVFVAVVSGVGGRSCGVPTSVSLALCSPCSGVDALASFSFP